MAREKTIVGGATKRDTGRKCHEEKQLWKKNKKRALGAGFSVEKKILDREPEKGQNGRSGSSLCYLKHPHLHKKNTKEKEKGKISVFKTC